jgi:quinol monooxygenase YgiN
MEAPPATKEIPVAELVVIATLVTAAGKADELVASFQLCAEETRLEDGCLAYVLHRDRKDENHFIAVERWRSQDDLDAHMKQPYLAAFMSSLGSGRVLSAKPVLHVTEAVTTG